MTTTTEDGIVQKKAILLILLTLATSEIRSEDRPVIAYADKNGDLGMGLWEIKIEIFKNGKVHYFGKGDAVYIQGDRYTYISQAKLKKLIKTFVNVHFFDMKLQPSLWSLWRPPLLPPPIMWDQHSPPSITFSYRGRERTTTERGEVIYTLRENIYRTVNFKQWACFPPSQNTDYKYTHCNYWYNN